MGQLYSTSDDIGNVAMAIRFTLLANSVVHSIIAHQVLSTVLLLTVKQGLPEQHIMLLIHFCVLIINKTIYSNNALPTFILPTLHLPGAMA